MASALPLAHDARGAFRTMQSQAESIILALDCGTTSVRAIVFEGDCARASAQREFTQHFPAPGLVEHDADEIWTALSACMKDAVERAGLRAQDVSAIGITNQRETIVVWDRATGRPIHRAIVWQDRRTAPVMDALRAAGHEERVREATGLTLDPYFSASKLAWILDHVDGARARAERGELAAGTIDAWVLWNLTKGTVHATDASNASRTMLARIGGPNGAAWDDALCELFHVPRAVLPEIVDSAGELGVVDASILDASILDASNRASSIPVTGIAGDQQAALFGQGAHAMGDAKCTFGTGCFLLANAGEVKPVPPKGLLATVAWRIAGRTMYAVEGSVFVGGSAVQWLRDGLQFFERAVEVNALAASVSDSGGVVVVPAFAGLGAPHWDASARGAILGLTRGATRAHIARATLEGVAHEVVDLIDAIRAGGVELHALRVDGGAAASDFLMQSCADFSQLAMERPKTLETTALGAARLARVGFARVGFAQVGLEETTLAPVPAQRQKGDILSAVSTIPGGLDRRFEPVLGAAELGRARARWNRAVDTVRFFGSPA